VARQSHQSIRIGRGNLVQDYREQTSYLLPRKYQEHKPSSFQQSCHNNCETSKFEGKTWRFLISL